jgi:hypothetical protein
MLFKLIFIFLLLGLNSLLICIIINYFLNLPKELSQDVNFRFSHDKKNLMSEIYFKEISRHPSEINLCTIYECINLDRYNYALMVEFEIANKNYPDNTNNYELELKMFNTKGDINYIRKLFYFDKDDNLLEIMSKLATLPFRLFGFYKTQNFNIVMIEEYDNYDRPLEKMEIYINGKSLNIKSCKFNFIPRIGFFRKLLSYLKIAALPVLFFIIFACQLVLIIILVYFFRKENLTFN